MYLKKVNERKAKTLTEVAPFVTGVWYVKMNDNGTIAKNRAGQPLYTCMNNVELQKALQSKEFSGVE